MCNQCTKKAEHHATINKKNISKHGHVFADFQEKLSEGDAEVLFTKHAGDRELFRAFSRSGILEAIQNGWEIEMFSNGYSLTLTILYHFRIDTKTYRPIHVVCELQDNTLTVITAYDPRTHSWKWNEHYDKRVCFCKKEEVIC